MIMNPESLEAGSARAARAYAPSQGGRVTRLERREQARRASAARAFIRDQRDVEPPDQQCLRVWCVVSSHRHFLKKKNVFSLKIAGR